MELAQYFQIYLFSGIFNERFFIIEKLQATYVYQLGISSTSYNVLIKWSTPQIIKWICIFYVPGVSSMVATSNIQI